MQVIENDIQLQKALKELEHIFDDPCCTQDYIRAVELEQAIEKYESED
jgi:hypothetical protein